MSATFDILQSPGAAPVCSRAGCSEDARWRINWRNPRIHAVDRVKIWAACDDHRGFLADYLRSRSFPVEVTGIDEDIDHLEDHATAEADTDMDKDMGADPGMSAHTNADADVDDTASRQAR